MFRLFCLSVSAFAFSLSCGGNSGEGENYEEVLLRAQAEVSSAGFGVAEALVDATSCATDEDCADAGDLLAEEYQTYLPVLHEHIERLEASTVPDKYTGLHDAYVRQLKLRVDAGELFQKGWETGDEDLIDESFVRLQESQAALGELLDELEALQD